MTVRFSEEDPAITDKSAFTAEEPELTNAESNGSAKGAAVVVVEEDPNLLHRHVAGLAQALQHTLVLQPGQGRMLLASPAGSPSSWCWARLRPTTSSWTRSARLLRGRPGTGAVLVLTQPSAEVLRSALRSGIDDAIETYDLERQLPQAVTELVHRLERELAAAAAEAARRAAPVGRQEGLGDDRLLAQGRRRQVGGLGQPGDGAGQAHRQAVGHLRPGPSVRRRGRHAAAQPRAHRGGRHVRREPARQEPAADLPGPPREEQRLGAGRAHSAVGSRAGRPGRHAPGARPPSGDVRERRHRLSART